MPKSLVAKYWSVKRKRGLPMAYGLDLSGKIFDKTHEGRRMPNVQVVLYKEKDGTVPVSDWLDGLLPKVQDKCTARIRRLRDLGHELRRPEADYLRDGIYELRVRYRSINYWMLYFFHGTQAVVLSHGLVKEREVPAREIERAIERKRKFESDPEAHTFRREL